MIIIALIRDVMKPYDDLVSILKKYKPQKYVFDKTPSMLLSSDNLGKDSKDQNSTKKKCSC